MSYHLDKAVARVRDMVTSVAPWLAPNRYVVFGGVFRSVLEGRDPKDIDLSFQDDGQGADALLQRAKCYGAPEADVLRGMKSREEMRAAGFGFHHHQDGWDVFVYTIPRIITMCGSSQVTLSGYVAVDYNGGLTTPNLGALQHFIDHVAAAAWMPFTVAPGGVVVFEEPVIPEDFEHVVQNRLFVWRPSQVAFKNEKVARVTRYLVGYGYKIPDRATLNTIVRLLQPDEVALNIWLLHNPHLR